MKTLPLVCLIISLFVISCSEISMDIPDPPPPEGRVNLIEEFTGVMCAGCADGAIILNDILKNSNGTLVAYSVHGSFLADPFPESKYDFRYPDSKELEQFFPLSVKPAISINRSTDDQGNLEVSDGIAGATWQGLIDAKTINDQIVDISVDIDFDASTRLLEIFGSATALEKLEGVINIHAVISESHLIDAQTNGSELLSEFEHNHVLKESLTNIKGDFLSDGLETNQTKSKFFTFTLPEENDGEWNTENIEVTIFVSSELQNGEVLQAAQVQIQE